MVDNELEACRVVQQILLPEAIDAAPGFRIESVYQPAQQVGGDFYQVVPDGKSGMLLVMGDVAGKGLPAAMLVSVMVGAFRSIAEFTQDPAQILARLNERLVGRAGTGVSTALVAWITAGGQVAIANAGHLSPYLDGSEVELPGALPLGVASGVSYVATEFALRAGSRLTFVSDGVVEAQNARQGLFGFERTAEVSTSPAADIAQAATRFGQEDDITVVTIERCVAESAVASLSSIVLAAPECAAASDL
jgi:serine phosphatase RsbU (regulator of sigma subunit)